MRPTINSGSQRAHHGMLPGSFILFLLVGVLPSAPAQWNTEARIVLDGTDDPDRQLFGAGDPLMIDAAVTVNAVRSTSTTFTIISGWVPLTGSLTPSPTALSTGMMITAIPSSTNPAAPLLDLNGMGAMPIVDANGSPLDSAVLLPGIPARLIFDGAHYVMLNAQPLVCAPGYSAPNRAYCIADSSREANTFFAAALDCAASGARLCTLSEWANACFHFPGFFATVPSGEWVDHAANHESTAKIAGAGDNGTVIGQGCDFGTLSVPTGLFRYRCCTSR